MKISTEIASAARMIGEQKTIEYVAKVGFDCWDFSMFKMCLYSKLQGRVLEADNRFSEGNYIAFARELRQIGLDNGITCNQSHAPFPSNVPQVHSCLKRAIECTAEAGGKICVIHPMNDGSVEENRDMYLELLPFAKEHGVKLATENMWNWNEDRTHSVFAACATSESFCEHLEAVNDEYFVACLDIGHAEMRGSGSGAVNMIRALGHHLQALHLHDNDLLLDCHELPYSMGIDFDAVIKALAEIGYRGDFTLEVDTYLKNHYPDDVFTGIKNMANVARRMADAFEQEVAICRKPC